MHHFEDGGEVQEAQIRRVELVEPRENAPAALESLEQTFDLVPHLVGFPVVVPFDFPVRLRRHDRRHPKVADELAGLVALAGAVNRQRLVRLPRPGAVGMHLGAVAVEAEAVRVLADRFLLPKRGEQPLEHAAAGPAAEPGVDRLPFVETLWQGTPLAAVLQDVPDRVDEDDVRNPHVPALNRQTRVDFGVLFCCGLFHDCVPLDFYVFSTAT